MAGLNKSEVNASDTIASMPKVEKKEKMVKVRFLHPAYLGEPDSSKTSDVVQRDLCLIDNVANYGDIRELPKSRADKFLNMTMKKNILNADKFVTDPNDPRLVSEVPIAILVEED